MVTECKKCLLLASAQEDMLKLIEEKIEKLSPTEKASQKVYQSRLACCQACEYLVSGTCLKCGCYVEFRAAFINQRCPDATNRRW